MKNVMSRVRSWTFAACTAASLGFGAVQAVASPAQARGPGPALCNGVDCNAYCAARGGESQGCFGGTCFCRIWVS